MRNILVAIAVLSLSLFAFGQKTASTIAPGLVLDSSGTISGTPTQAGTFPFSVKVTDSLGNTATANLSITVVAALSITTAMLPEGTVGQPYTQKLSASGGSGQGYQWSAVSASVAPTAQKPKVGTPGD